MCSLLVAFVVSRFRIVTLLGVSVLCDVTVLNISASYRREVLCCGVARISCPLCVFSASIRSCAINLILSCEFILGMVQYIGNNFADCPIL